MVEYEDDRRRRWVHGTQMMTSQNAKALLLNRTRILIPKNLSNAALLGRGAFGQCKHGDALANWVVSVRLHPWRWKPGQRRNASCSCGCRFLWCYDPSVTRVDFICGCFCNRYLELDWFRIHHRCVGMSTHVVIAQCTFMTPNNVTVVNDYHEFQQGRSAPEGWWPATAAGWCTLACVYTVLIKFV